MSNYLKYSIVGQFSYYFTFVSETFSMDLFIKMIFRAFKNKQNLQDNFVLLL